ncbi:hypothetical protein [Streptomyces vinaceus]|nr:hypothetical protein [Streptomyces vinaceus]
MRPAGLIDHDGTAVLTAVLTGDPAGAAALGLTLDLPEAPRGPPPSPCS